MSVQNGEHLRGDGELDCLLLAGLQRDALKAVNCITGWVTEAIC